MKLAASLRPLVFAFERLAMVLLVVALALASSVGSAHCFGMAHGGTGFAGGFPASHGGFVGGFPPPGRGVPGGMLGGPHAATPFAHGHPNYYGHPYYHGSHGYWPHGSNVFVFGFGFAPYAYGPYPYAPYAYAPYPYYYCNPYAPYPGYYCPYYGY